jgi:PLP dependent protein
MTDVKENLARLKKRISDDEKKYGRESGSVNLLAISKGQPVEKIRLVIEAGQRHFGENHVQEAEIKIVALADKSIEWHFIGHIQSNKTKKIAEHFTWVHSVDSMKIAKRLNDQRSLPLPPLNVCIEVNLEHETTKSGVAPHEVLALASYCLTLPRLALRGLMTIPPASQDMSEQRKAFHALFLIQQNLAKQGIVLDTLSMGMSDDMESAIAEGATIVRIGTALFGARHKL